MVKHPLATTSWDQEEFNAIKRVIDSGYFTMGEQVAEFEAEFARWQGARFAVMVNSGSSANLLMVAALFFRQDPSQRLKAGDEVIVPAVSWSTTFFPLHQYGLKLLFVDIDLQTLNYDLDALAHAVTDQTRAIMAVNLLGNPNDYDKIANIIGDRNIILMEDNCESMGATIGARKAGSFGLVGSFSAFFSHHISTMEGGLVVTDDEEIYQIMLSLRAHGWTRHLPEQNLVSGRKSSDPFEESFKFVLPGYNLRPLEMSGAIGLCQLRKLPGIVEGRRANARLLQETLSNHPAVMIQQEIGESSWFGFSLVARPGSGVMRTRMLEVLRNAGFECRPIVAGNFTRNPAMSWLNCSVPVPLVNADHIHDNGLFIGNHPYPIPETISDLHATLSLLA